ncbi:RNA polymerase sigma factor [Gammaproteobacteria bacterium MOLA455]|nr:RNA polymerase sigma factor [Gammaproteobacteria bacterium MOLA455]
MLASGIRLENGCIGDKVSRNQQHREQFDPVADSQILLDRDRLEIEELILNMTAAGAGITQTEIDQLYKDTSNELRRLLVRKLGDKEGAEALAQDAYLKLLRIKHNQDVGDLRHYLFSMAVRLALNVLRKRKMDSQYYGHKEESARLSTLDSCAYRVLLDELKRETLKESIAQLPEKTRYIYLLHEFKRLPAGEIARQLDASEALIATHIDCAKGQTEKALTEFVLMDV